MSLVLLAAFFMMSTCHIKPTYLRCDADTMPLAIRGDRPDFSWQLASTDPSLKNLRQTAYEVRVSRDLDNMEARSPDLWDSGKVESSASYGVTYGGKDLPSAKLAYWSVRVWDEEGLASAWSPAKPFSRGLRSADWTAKWISIDPPDSVGPKERFSGTSWIWSQDQVGEKIPAGSKTFTRAFQCVSLPLSANLEITADDQYELFVNGERMAASDGAEDAWRRYGSIDIAPHLKVGQNELKVVATNSLEGNAGALAKLVVKFADGHRETLVSDASWQEAGGKAARVVAAYGAEPWGDFASTILRPATYYRKEFTPKKGLERATAYVTALGLVDFHLNGRRVSEDLFTPGWTDYDKRVYYRAYDLTPDVKHGANAMGAVLGDGWYSGYLGYSHSRGHYGDRPRVKVQLVLEYHDGSHETIDSDFNWRASTGGTIEQDFLAGETYDARLEPVGWDKVGFDDSEWLVPYQTADTAAVIEAHPGPPVRPYQTIEADTVRQVRPGVYILDFKQNLAGFIRFNLGGSPGQTIQFRYAEKLNPDGTLYTANLRSARATDTYTFKSGDRYENWSPRFTFHGFQYVEVSGLTRPPRPDEIQAVAISSATPEVGSIETSDPMINQLASNAWWTQKMNFIDVPTDCPQRDERLGWTGDAQAYIATAARYSDVQGFFTKWLQDLEDAQRADGQFPMVAPLKVAEADGGPAWADAGVICPWTIYQVYGDKRELAQRYESMKRFVEFCRNRSTPELLPPAQFHCFGDWVNINADTPNEVIYESYFAGSARILAHAAEALGKASDAAEYNALADKVRAAFNRAYVSPDGIVKGDTQCAYVLALAFDLLDDKNAKIAADRLVADIERRGWHLSTGFVGTRDLMQVLSKVGRNDVAFRLLHNTTFPSWGFEIQNGATSIWERWDGWTPEKGFQTPGMNSFAHYAYGAVMEWVYATIGGIKPLAPGYEKVLIAPQIDPNLTHAKVGYESVRGLITVSWRVVDKNVSLDVEIPPNMSAEVVIPGNGAVHQVGSGHHSFSGRFTPVHG